MQSDLSLPLILIPGHMGTALDWRIQHEAFRNACRVVIPDGHYQLNSLSLMAANIATHLPPKFNLIGWSMGGYIAFELVKLCSERINRLVLLHTSARPESPDATQRRQLLLERVENEGMAAVYRQEIPRLMLNPAAMTPAYLVELLAERVRLGRATLVSQIEALITRADSRPWLASIACDTLVIAGDHDGVAPVEHAEEMAAMIPQGTLRVLEGAGHCSPWEKPEHLNKLLREYLSL